MTPIIQVSGISKEYRISHQARSLSPTVKDALVDMVRRPIQRIRRQDVGSHEQFWALRDVSFDVEPGEVVGIIGRNGSGKSTLLKILSRIVDPTEGEIRVRGRVASLLEVGTGFHVELTGRENIYLNGSILGMTGREISSKFDEIVAFSEVEQFLDTPVKFYSSGMYVRLAFAVAAHLDPDILIIDEVLAVGDVQFQKKCLGKMSEVAGAGRTVLFVSHNVAAVENLCTQGLVLRRGVTSGLTDVRTAVDNYLDRESQGEARFAEGAVRRLAARQQDQTIEINMDYYLTELPPQVEMGFIISDHEGRPVTGGNQTIDAPVVGEPARATVVITEPHLLDGTYRLSFWLTFDKEEAFAGEHCLSFDVSEMAGRGQKPAKEVGPAECRSYLASSQAVIPL